MEYVIGGFKRGKTPLKLESNSYDLSSFTPYDLQVAITLAQPYIVFIASAMEDMEIGALINSFTAVNEREQPRQSHPAELCDEDPTVPQTPQSHLLERFSTPNSPEDQGAHNADAEPQLRADPVLVTTLETALMSKIGLIEGEERALRVVKITTPSTKTTCAFREMPAVRTSVEL